jgi:hypothetical protein
LVSLGQSELIFPQGGSSPVQIPGHRVHNVDAMKDGQ